MVIKRNKTIIFTMMAAAALYSGTISFAGVEEVGQKIKEGSVSSFGRGQDSASTAVKTGTVSVNTRLNVRNSPWGEIIGKIADGAQLEITGQEGEWYIINYNGAKAFVHSSYVKTGSAPSTNTPGPSAAPSSSSTEFEGVIKTSGKNLNVRTAPWGPIVGVVAPGSAVKVTGKSGDWYKIEYNGQSCFVFAENVVKKGEQTSPATPGTSPATPPVADNQPVPPTNPGTSPPAPPDPSTPPYVPQKNSYPPPFDQSLQPPVQGFVFPVEGHCAFSTESYSKYHTFHTSLFDFGVDIIGKTGLKLLAVRKGTIGKMRQSSTGGNMLHLISDNGYDHFYGHLSSYADIRPGMPVEAGTLVGLMGSTGSSSCPHLHISCVRNERSIELTQILIATKHSQVNVSGPQK